MKQQRQKHHQNHYDSYGCRRRNTLASLLFIATQLSTITTTFTVTVDGLSLTTNPSSHSTTRASSSSSLASSLGHEEIEIPRWYQYSNQRQHNNQQRREFCTKAMAGMLGYFTSSSAALSPSSTANAACLPGDLSKDCIGVYKLPYLDATQSSWLYDRETLQQFAPDIRYIEVEKQPKTIQQAKEQLLGERKKVRMIKEIVLEGNLEQAGTIILNLIPKVTSACLKIQDDLFDDASNNGDGRRSVAAAGGTAATAAAVASTMNELKKKKFESAFQIVVAEWSSIDIAIGQAIRGQRGVTAVAQIEILSYLKDATAALDDLIALIDDIDS